MWILSHCLLCFSSPLPRECWVVVELLSHHWCFHSTPLALLLCPGDCGMLPSPYYSHCSVGFQGLCAIHHLEQGVCGSAAVPGFHVPARAKRWISSSFCRWAPYGLSSKLHPFQPCIPGPTPQETTCLRARSRQNLLLFPSMKGSLLLGSPVC